MRISRKSPIARLSRKAVILCAWAPALILASTSEAQTSRPLLIYDEAHHNNGADGPFGALLDIPRSMGVEVRIGRRSLDQELLAGPKLLIIAGGLSMPREKITSFWSADAARPAFTQKEIEAVVRWVQSGGRLLMFVDHASDGGGSAELGRALGVDLRNTFTWDGLHLPPGYTSPKPDPRRASYIMFTRRAGMIGEHPITNGMRGGRRVNAVATYAGSSLRGPVGSTALLILSDSALDYFRAWRDGPEYRWSAAGRSQAVAYELGAGRVVVMGEKAVLMKDPFGREHSTDPQRLGMGLDYVHADNRQFAQNLFLWLMVGLDSTARGSLRNP